MTSHRIHQIARLGLLAGAILFALHLVLRSFLTAGVEPTEFARQVGWVPLNVLGVGGAVLVLFALPAVYARVRAPSGASAWSA